MNARTQKHKPRRSAAPLGQHFLTRPEIAGWVADAAHLSPDDTVLEIGPGHGILTRALLERAGKVVALEKDAGLVAQLRERFADEIASNRLTILDLDVRDFDPSHRDCPVPGPYHLVANIPYYITGRIVRQFLTTTHKPQNIALLIQKEVAERIVAKNDKESLLSLSVQAYGEPHIARIVRAGAFSPPPKVDSAILVVEHIRGDVFQDTAHEQRFFELIHAAFAEKRKQVGKTLRNKVTLEDLARCDIDAKTRPEDVSCEMWLMLAKSYRQGTSASPTH